MAWGDVDGDGDEDFYLGAAAGQAGAIYFNEKYERFFDRNRARGDFDADRASEDMAPLFFDADGDADLDLYVVSGSLECGPTDAVLRDRLYINDGTGNFSKAPDGTLPDEPDSGSVVAAADFDRDGDVDLFVGGRQVPGVYPLPPSSRLLRNEGGRFTDVTDDLAKGLRMMGLVTSALWSDANNDGWLDLLVTHEWGPVRLWLWDSTNGQLVERTGATGLGEHFGWWNGIAAGDVDNDGDIDYAVTNFGLNTKYHAHSDKPAMLYCGDFEQKGRIRLIEAEYEGDILFPVRGKSCSSSAMPFLTEKYNTFKGFAAAPLEEIYTPERLQRAVQLTVTTLESGIYINNIGTNGKFEFHTFPRITQASPGFGVIIADVNGDGNADIYLVQNFHSPQAETGRMDGGVSVLLLGDGTAKFEPLLPDRSGLLVPGDAKALTISDLNNDSWPDFTVGINDGKAMTFENTGSKTNRPLKVRLEGNRTGNPTAIGARVTLQLDDNSTKTAEIYAGGGYLSQSTSTVFFGLGGSRTVQRVQVQWPDGKVTAEKPAPGARSVVLKQP